MSPADATSQITSLKEPAPVLRCGLRVARRTEAGRSLEPVLIAHVRHWSLIHARQHGQPVPGGQRIYRRAAPAPAVIVTYAVALTALGCLNPVGASVPLAVAGLLVLAACGGTALVPGVRRLTGPTAREPQLATCADRGRAGVDRQPAARAIATKLRQASGPKVSVAPSRSFESRTSTTPGRLSATSTQSPPLPPLLVLVRHRAPVMSMIPPLL